MDVVHSDGAVERHLLAVHGAQELLELLAKLLNILGHFFGAIRVELRRAFGSSALATGRPTAAGAVGALQFHRLGILLGGRWL
ncbi:hypothetical protein D3C71_1965490 [compost metagenome]